MIRSSAIADSIRQCELVWQHETVLPCRELRTREERREVARIKMSLLKQLLLLCPYIRNIFRITKTHRIHDRTSVARQGTMPDEYRVLRGKGFPTASSAEASNDQTIVGECRGGGPVELGVIG